MLQKSLCNISILASKIFSVPSFRSNPTVRSVVLHDKVIWGEGRREQY